MLSWGVSMGCGGAATLARLGPTFIPVFRRYDLANRIGLETNYQHGYDNMSVVLLEPVHWHPTPKHLFLYNWLDRPLKHTANGLKIILETPMTSVACLISKNIKYCKKNFFHIEQ